MARLKVQEMKVASLERLLEAVRQAGIRQLKAVLACTFTFNRTYFDQVCDAIADTDPDGFNVLRLIPIDVVCDFRHFSNRSPQYNVALWHGDGLFHPKLFMLLFTDRIVWSEGSLNLTPAGYNVNRELVTYHESDRGLPDGLRRLIGQLARQGVEAAKRIDSIARNVRTDTKNRSVTSLDAPILPRFLNRTKKAQSVHIVAPFMDQRDQEGAAIEAAAMNVLARSYPSATFRLFLPEVSSSDGTQALQGSKKVFFLAFGNDASPKRLAICGVPSDEKPLHGKLIAVRHGKGGARATVLIGSPNITEAALMQKGPRANVELARELALRWVEVEKLLRPLGNKFKPLSKCRFAPQRPITATGWHVLNSATYYPLRQRLVIEWRKPEFSSKTYLLYAGTRLVTSASGEVRGLGIRDGELRLKCVSREDPSRWSWHPILIPYECQIALQDLPAETDPPPEWWLRQLGALPSSSTRKNSSLHGNGRANPNVESFTLGQRVRELADRMRFAMDVIRDRNPQASLRVAANLDLLEKIFDAHDPSKVHEASERTWRMWVRLEVAQTIASSIKGEKGASKKARRLARALRDRLRATTLPGIAGPYWRALMDIQP